MSSYQDSVRKPIENRSSTSQTIFLKIFKVFFKWEEKHGQKQAEKYRRKWGQTREMCTDQRKSHNRNTAKNCRLSPGHCRALLCFQPLLIWNVHIRSFNLQSWKLWPLVGLLFILFFSQAGSWHRCWNTDAQTTLLVCTGQLSDIASVTNFQHLFSLIPLKKWFHLTTLHTLFESQSHVTSEGPYTLLRAHNSWRLLGAFWWQLCTNLELVSSKLSWRTQQST